MTAKRAGYSLVDRYLMALRIVQPARLSDINDAIAEIWPGLDGSDTIFTLREIHRKLRNDGFIVPVRRSTYVLTTRGMNIVAGMRKAREIDNARMFLMKAQRRKYHRRARWSGQSAVSAFLIARHGL